MGLIPPLFLNSSGLAFGPYPKYISRNSGPSISTHRPAETESPMHQENMNSPKYLDAKALQIPKRESMDCICSTLSQNIGTDRLRIEAVR